MARARARARCASPLACAGVAALVLAYTALGAALFLALEGAPPPPPAERARPARDSDLRASTVERLWAITEDLNILYKENWTKLAAKELLDFQRVLVESMRSDETSGAERDRAQRWTFSTSFLYALTLITTIGHGGLAPRSAAGRLAALLYACGGVPLVMVYLAALGGALAHQLRAAYARLRAPHRPRPRPKQCADSDSDKDKVDKRTTPFQAALNLDSLSGSGGYRWRCEGGAGGEGARVPAALGAVLVAAYVALGALLFRATERWALLDGCYFAVASLATIGFGELRPGLYASSVSARAEDVAIGACCAYILVGIVVVATCFDLVREELGGVRAVHAPCGDALALAVVS